MSETPSSPPATRTEAVAAAVIGWLLATVLFVAMLLLGIAIVAMLTTGKDETQSTALTLSPIYLLPMSFGFLLAYFGPKWKKRAKKAFALGLWLGYGLCALCLSLCFGLSLNFK